MSLDMPVILRERLAAVWWLNDENHLSIGLKILPGCVPFEVLNPDSGKSHRPQRFFWGTDVIPII
jgi:hypothetical protein